MIQTPALQTGACAELRGLHTPFLLLQDPPLTPAEPQCHEGRDIYVCAPVDSWHIVGTQIFVGGMN